MLDLKQSRYLNSVSNFIWEAKTISLPGIIVLNCRLLSVFFSILYTPQHCFSIRVSLLKFLGCSQINDPCVLQYIDERYKIFYEWVSPDAHPRFKVSTKKHILESVNMDHITQHTFCTNEVSCWTIKLLIKM